MRNILLSLLFMLNSLVYAQQIKEQDNLDDKYVSKNKSLISASNEIQLKIETNYKYKNSNQNKGDNTYVIESDSLALVELYNSNGGSNWYFHKDSIWLEGPVYKWDGIEVNNGRIIKINLIFHNIIGNLDPAIGSLSELQILDLSYNDKITSLPTEIGNLSKLEYLNMARNSLTSVPVEIGKLSSLKYLDFWDNRIELVPSEIGNLKLLEYLVLDNNLLETVPSEIGNLTNLKKLYLGGNHLTNLPDLSGLINIQWLFVDYNNLTFNDLSSTNLKLNEIEWVIYSPQSKLAIPFQTNDGNTRTLTCQLDEPGTTYKWFKYPATILNGQTNKTLELSNLDSGLYYCEISHNTFPELLLSTGLLGRNSGLTTFTLSPNGKPFQSGSVVGEFNRNLAGKNFFSGYYTSNITYERVGVLQLDHEDFSKKLTIIDENTCSTYLGFFEDKPLYITINEDNSVDVESDTEFLQWELHDIDWGTSSYDPETGVIHLFYGYTYEGSGVRKFEEVFSVDESLNFPNYSLVSDINLNQGNNNSFKIENNVLKAAVDLNGEIQYPYDIFVEIRDLVFGLNYTEEFIINVSTNDILNFNRSSESRVFPNPSNGMFTIKSNDNIKELKCFDLRGNLLYQADGFNCDQTIDFTNRSKGVYFISYYTQGSVYIEKLIIK